MRFDIGGGLGADVSSAEADPDGGALRGVPLHGDRVDQWDPVLRQDQVVLHAGEAPSAGFLRQKGMFLLASSLTG